MRPLRWSLPIVCAAGFGLVICASLVHCAPSMIARAKNVQPGDADYPALNPHPAALLALHGRLPQTLKIELRVAYVANLKAGTLSNDYCRYRYDLNTFSAFSIVEPIAIVRSDDRFKASVAIDRYLRGRCGWHFNGIQYALSNSRGELTGDWFAVEYDAERDGSNRASLPVMAPKVWCIGNRDLSDRTRPELCGNLSNLQLVSSIPAKLLATIPQQDRANRGVIWLFPGTRSVELDFYDLDAMAAAL